MIEQEICFGIDGEEWVLNDNKKRHMCDNATYTQSYAHAEDLK